MVIISRRSQMGSTTGAASNHIADPFGVKTLIGSQTAMRSGRTGVVPLWARFHIGPGETGMTSRDREGADFRALERAQMRASAACGSEATHRSAAKERPRRGAIVRSSKARSSPGPADLASSSLAQPVFS